MLALVVLVVIAIIILLAIKVLMKESVSTAHATPLPGVSVPTLASGADIAMTPTPSGTTLTGNVGFATPSVMPLAESTTSAIEVPAAAPIDVPTLQARMLALINGDRRAAGLSEIVWDSTAAGAGMAHAAEMARFGYLSHWNLDGYGPDYRYSAAGGRDAVRENVYAYDHSRGGGPTSAVEWETLLRNTQAALMDSSGHRANILAPEHTHVGIGMAYNAAEGRFRIAQEFVDRYVALEEMPQAAASGESILISGRLLEEVSQAHIALAYEPPLTPLSVAQLRATGTYSSPAEVLNSMTIAPNASRRFSASVNLDDKGRAGIYHIWVFVETKYGQVMANDVIINVR